MLFDNTKIILDLCGGSGAWSRPYTEHGYDVRLVTLPQDVRLYEPPENVYGILAAPPCTLFSLARNRWERTEEEILQALSIIDACLRMVVVCNPVFWALENSVGELFHYMGKPQWVFDPYEYGDPYTKKTALWGKCAIPQRAPVPATMGSMMHTMVRDSAKRGITPQGFARAF